MRTYQINSEGYYGEFGGAYIPEILHRCVEELRANYRRVLDSDDFKTEFDSLLRDYVGRPSPLYLARRLSERYGCTLYLKREDLNHTGAHKSIMPSGKSSLHAAWANTVSSPRQVPASTGLPRLPCVP